MIKKSVLSKLHNLQVFEHLAEYWLLDLLVNMFLLLFFRKTLNEIRNQQIFRQNEAGETELT